jgi:hypothetical protein
MIAVDRFAAKWRRASASIPFNDCVEVMVNHENVRVRDSKEPHAADLRFHPAAWAEFVSHIHPH